MFVYVFVFVALTQRRLPINFMAYQTSKTNKGKSNTPTKILGTQRKKKKGKWKKKKEKKNEKERSTSRNENLSLNWKGPVTPSKLSPIYKPNTTPLKYLKTL